MPERKTDFEGTVIKWCIKSIDERVFETDFFDDLYNDPTLSKNLHDMAGLREYESNVAAKVILSFAKSIINKSS